MKLDELIQLVRTLRRECPWDRVQTMDSLKGKLIEEAYELVDAIEQDAVDDVIEELGDIIFLAFFLVRILEEESKTSMDEILTSAIKKYQEKHPHVFAGKDLKDEHDVLQFWHRSKKDIFSGVPVILPALLAAKVIQERAARLGFDWASRTGPMDKVEEEYAELKKSGHETQPEEMGDLLFACVNLSRHLKIDPEESLRQANKKFVRRFRAVIEELRNKGKDTDDVTLEEMDRIWDDVKKSE